MDPFEIIGFVFGVAGVWLTGRGSVWCFPVGLVNVSVSLVLFFNQKLYSDAVQQAVYIVLLSYGWYRWSHGQTGSNLPVRHLGWRNSLLLSLTVMAVASSMGYFFDTFTDADFPYVDALATALSFAAQYLIARRIIENWLIWMVVNMMYIGIYMMKDLKLYTVLFAVYLMLAVYGWWQWRTMIRNQSSHAG